ncbi:MAG: SCO family protein [Pseudolabrys sp.]|nr:SCO family protein [Pseudolabrys sp.]MDP2296166.1 SCO family protein [Pseudolabrys sp.]
MTTRASHILLVVSAFLAGLVIFLGVFMFATGNLGGGSGAPSASAIGGPFQLIDQDGKPISDQDMKGKPFLVFFGFTHCPDVCPTALFEVSELMRALGKDADRTAALFITVDPERDTAAKLKDYLSSFDPRLRAATGERPAIEAVQKAYRVYAKKVPSEKGGDDYSMDHTALVYLMDKQGRFVAPFNLKRTPAEAAAEMRKYL